MTSINVKNSCVYSDSTTATVSNTSKNKLWNEFEVTLQHKHNAKDKIEETIRKTVATTEKLLANESSKDLSDTVKRIKEKVLTYHEDLWNQEFKEVLDKKCFSKNAKPPTSQHPIYSQLEGFILANLSPASEVYDLLVEDKQLNEILSSLFALHPLAPIDDIRQIVIFVAGYLKNSLLKKGEIELQEKKEFLDIAAYVATKFSSECKDEERFTSNLTELLCDSFANISSGNLLILVDDLKRSLKKHAESKDQDLEGLGIKIFTKIAHYWMLEREIQMTVVDKLFMKIFETYKKIVPVTPDMIKKSLNEVTNDAVEDLKKNRL